ncbi:MAG: polysaccharide pyruvyl transferase family protein [Prevotellaceae bacterium]|nr:polysaccharide pyruvyl transferase family protein [Prevotellaceae bacterium]
MKKIALVTCYFQHNYGSQLQALATQMVFDKLELENETICIDGLKPEINRAKYRYFLSKAFDKNTVKDKMATVRKIIAKKTNPDYAHSLAIRDKIFTDFANTQFKLSQRYSSKMELGSHANEYSAFVVGSDQLWLPSNIAANYYTLNFVPDHIKKIAYATSFGVSSLPHKQEIEAEKFLKRLDAIFVREISGQKLVKKLTGKEVPLVCDPTLLFTSEEWNRKAPAGRRIQAPYILCYFLGNNPEQRLFARRLAEKTGYRIVQLPNLDEYIKSDEGFADDALYDVSPLDFVALIRDAQYVLTDSFHCTVFSSLFCKSFFSFRRYNNDSIVSTNSRIYSLLDTLGVQERLLDGIEDIDRCLQMDINFEAVHKRIQYLRQQSVKMLLEALNA